MLLKIIAPPSDPPSGKNARVNSAGDRTSFSTRDFFSHRGSEGAIISATLKSFLIILSYTNYFQEKPKL